MRNHIIAALISMSLLGGCAQMRQAQRESAANEKQASCNARRSEMEAKKREDQLAYLSGKSIAPKFPLNGPITYEQTQDRAKPTPQESSELFGLRDLVSRQQLNSTGWWIDCAPRSVSNAKFESNRNVLSALDDLAMQRITYGEAMLRIRSANQEFDSALPSKLAEARQIEADAVAAQEREYDERARAAANAAAMTPRPSYVLPQPPALPRIPTPTQTNCYKSGNQLNCTTY